MKLDCWGADAVGFRIRIHYSSASSHQLPQGVLFMCDTADDGVGISGSIPSELKLLTVDFGRRILPTDIIGPTGRVV